MVFNYQGIWNVIRASLLKTTQWKLFKWIFGSMSGLIAFLLIGKNFFKAELNDSIFLSIKIIIFIFLIKFLLIFISECLKYFHEVYKNSIYGDTIIILKDIFSHIHNYRNSNEHDDVEFMKSIINICNGLQLVFNNLTKSNCSVSIKIPVKDSKIDEKSSLKNLTRDQKNSFRDTKKYEELKHTIIGNTAFTNTFNKVLNNSKNKYYLNNNISKDQNYNNTSRDCYPDGMLPYKSEIVFPIVPILSREKGNYDCQGFICIDSDTENAFGNKYQIAIIEGIADGIYDLFLLKNKITTE